MDQTMVTSKQSVVDKIDHLLDERASALRQEIEKRISQLDRDTTFTVFISFDTFETIVPYRLQAEYEEAGWTVEIGEDERSNERTYWMTFS